MPLHRLESLSTFYTHFRRTPPKRVEVAVCRDLSCAMARGGEAAERLRAALAGRDDVEIREVSCIGRCDRAPVAFVGHDVVSTTEPEKVVAIVDGRSSDPEFEKGRTGARPKSIGIPQIAMGRCARPSAAIGRLSPKRSTLRV